MEANKKKEKIFQFSAGPVFAPDGQKLTGPGGEPMMYVNDKIYTEEEGKKKLEEEAEKLWKTVYGDACKYCDFAPCVLETTRGKNLLQEGEVMQQHGDLFYTGQFLHNQFMDLIHDIFGRDNPSEGLPECVTCAITNLTSTSKEDEHVGVPNFAGFFEHAVSELADGKHFVAGFADLKKADQSSVSDGGRSRSSSLSSDGSADVKPSAGDDVCLSKQLEEMDQGIKKED